MLAMLEALEDGLAEPSDYLPALHQQVRVLSLLVDDLFELAGSTRARSRSSSA